MTADITFRPGVPDDSYSIFHVFEETLADLSLRLGHTMPTSWSDPDVLAMMWAERRSLYEHMAHTADQFWVAERAGQVIGFARSILRAGHRELTEFFVRPGQQSGGVGRELLARAESEAATRGREHFGLEIPMVNKTAVDYLLGRGYRFDAFLALFMSDAPAGQLENYVVTSPPFFL